MKYALAAVWALALLAGCTTALLETDGPKSGGMLFSDNCAACHGVRGRGDGPAAAGLDQAPADLTQIAARNGGRFPADDVLAKIHGYGGPGHFGDMPDFSDLSADDRVMWQTADGQTLATPRALVALVRHLEGLQR
ncbi:c-type cytochrome [Lentibacter sp.]|uniref:c-type cytochrome n=1 Tax=Lentibacter sp. TaxID=2024994 RepID=UPI003F6D9384